MWVFFFIAVSCIWFILGLTLYSIIFGTPPLRPKLKQYPILILFMGTHYIFMVLFDRAVSFLETVVRSNNGFFAKLRDWQNN